MSRIALLGTGAMGARVARRFLDAGHGVVAYNRTAQRAAPLLECGARYEPTPKAAAEQADIVISMVADDTASRTIWLDPQTGAAAGLRQDAIAVESSTLSIAWTQELAAALASRGIAFLDAPVVGSRPQAEAGKLAYLVGGEEETLARIHTILLCAGRAVHHLGPTGRGMIMKLAINSLFGIQVAALAEVLGLMAEHGMTTATAAACLRELPITSPAMQGACDRMLAKDHTPAFPICLVAKDFRYILQGAATVGTAAPLATAASTLYRQAIAAGGDNDNITGVAKLFSL